NQDYWFGPLHLPAGVGTGTLTVDDTSATSSISPMTPLLTRSTSCTRKRRRRSPLRGKRSRSRAPQVHRPLCTVMALQRGLSTPLWERFTSAATVPASPRSPP